MAGRFACPGTLAETRGSKLKTKMLIQTNNGFEGVRVLVDVVNRRLGLGDRPLTIRL
jgi:hypothetical protein